MQPFIFRSFGVFLLTLVKNVMKICSLLLTSIKILIFANRNNCDYEQTVFFDDIAPCFCGGKGTGHS